MALPSWWKLLLSSVDGSMTTQLVTVMLSGWWHWLYPCDDNTNCCLPGVCLLLPLLSSQRVLSRLYSVVLSLIVPFLLLSASHEGLFILALILNMFCWLLLELHSADSVKNRVMSQGLLYCMCGVHHLLHMAASFIKEHKLQVFRESRDIRSFSSPSYDLSKASSKASIVQSRTSSFKWEYPLLSLRSSTSFLHLLPHLPVTSIPPFIFPSITRSRRQFLHKMWPIQ